MPSASHAPEQHGFAWAWVASPSILGNARCYSGQRIAIPNISATVASMVSEQCMLNLQYRVVAQLQSRVAGVGT